MGDALLVACLATSLLMLSIVLLLCIRGRRDQTRSDDYEHPSRHRTTLPNNYIPLIMLPAAQTTAQESPPTPVVPPYENTLVIEEETPPPAGNGITHTPGRERTGSVRRQGRKLERRTRVSSLEDENDLAGGSEPEDGAEEAGLPVVPPRMGVVAVPRVGEESQSSITPPQVPIRKTGKVLKRQDAREESASVPVSRISSTSSSSSSSCVESGAVGGASEGDRLQDSLDSGSGPQGNHRIDRAGWRHCHEEVLVTPDGVKLTGGTSHTFPRLPDTRDSPRAINTDKFNTAPRRAMGHLDVVMVTEDSVQIVTSNPNAPDGANASLATQPGDADAHSDPSPAPPVPSRRREEGVGVVRLRK